MRLKSSPKPSLSTRIVLALVLAAPVAARTGYLDYAWEAVSISQALADGHEHEHGSRSRSEGGGEREGGSYSYHGGDDGGGSYSGGGTGSGSDYSGGGEGGYGSGGGYAYSGSGRVRGYSSNGISGYRFSGSGGDNAVPRGDGRPPSVGIPQPELKGLPKELRLDVGKDNKAWENLLNSHWNTRVGARGAGHASGAKGMSEHAKRDTEYTPRASHGAEYLPEVKGLGEHGGHGVEHASKMKGPGEHAGHEREHASGAKKTAEKSGRNRTKGWAPGKSGKAYRPAGNRIRAFSDPRSYSRTEVLAANLSPAGAARARALGFQVSGPGRGRGPGGGPGGGPGRGLGRGGVAVVKLPPGLDPARGMKLLQENLPGERFQLNNLYRVYQPAMKQDRGGRPARLAILGEKKCAGDRCYAQETIHWKDRFSSCARNVKIGIIDTGFDLRHPAFKHQKIIQRAFLPSGRPPASAWHGTGVLALLAGRADSGTPGLAPEATYHAASIFYADEGGDPVTDTVSFLKALDWMSESGVRLVNMSFSGPRDDLVQRKIEALSARGIVFTAAAGNNGPVAAPAYPAAYRQVIAVTAVTKKLKNYPYANRGAHIDIAAPGVGIWTAWPEAREGYRTGTSFASPFVTGVLALYPPDLLRSSKTRILERANISDLGPPGRDPIYGRGLLQAPPVCMGSASEVAGLGGSER